MDLVRGFVGFVFGAIVVAGLHFTGMLDGPSRWWSHHAAIGTVATAAPEDDGHSRYTIHAIHQSQGGDDCEPQYEFHNLTNRNVTFATGWDDQPPSAPPSSHRAANGAPVSLQSPNSGSPQGNDRQNDRSQSDSDQDDDDQDDGDQDTASHRNGDGNHDSGGYDDDYPGGGEGSACSNGVIQIFVDRKK